MLNWAKDRFEAMGKNLAAIPSKIASIPSAVSNGWQTTTAVGGAVTSWIGTKASDTANWVGNLTLEKVGNGLKTAVTETGNFFVHVKDNPTDSAKLFGQGVLNGGASIVGMVGALGKVVINNNPARWAVNGGATFVGLEAPWEKITYDITGNLLKTANKTGWVADIEKRNGRPLNGYEKTILYGTQGTAEVAAFVGIAIATGGAGAAAMAGGRSAAILNRAAQAGYSAATRSRGAAKLLNITTHTAPLRGVFNGAHWANPFLNRPVMALESGGVAFSMYSAWKMYNEELSEGDAKIAQALGATQDGEENSPTWDQLSALYAEATKDETKYKTTIAYAGEGSKIKDNFSVKAEGDITETPPSGEKVPAEQTSDHDDLTRGL